MKTAMKSSIRVRSFFFLSLAVALLCVPSVRAEGKYKVKFGLMSQNANGQSFVFQETRNVQHRVDPNYFHGFTVQRKGGGQFMVSYSIRFPEPLENVGLSDVGRWSEGGTVYTSLDRIVWDSSHDSFLFSDGDPIGTYELSVFVDGKLNEKIQYFVEKPVKVDDFDENLGF